MDTQELAPTPIATPSRQLRILTLSTLAFTVCFAVWTLFSIIGLPIKAKLGLSDSEFALLIATPVLTGSLSRILLGIWADQYGGRLVYTLLMLATSVAVWLLASVESYPMFLLAALGVGLAGGSFAVGVAYVSRWFESARQGTALGIFGIGNVGAACTNFFAPFLVLALGWESTARVYAAALLTTAVLFWLLTEDDPVTAERKRHREKAPAAFLQLEPLKRLQVWRFALYYFFAFGGFVAFSLWLPRYYVGFYGLDLKAAGMLASAYSFTSLLRAVGGVLADKWGARRIMYLSFIGSVACTFFLSYPATDYIVHGIEGPIRFTLAMPLWLFTLMTMALGLFMTLGTAAVYKHIPVYYPGHVGAVGGLVGMIGGLGGFFLPICFGVMNDLIGVWTSCFMLMFALVATALTWMHLAIRRMEQAALAEELKKLPELPEMAEIHTEEHVRAMGKYFTP
ncbi:nitrate/nitrite transporter [Methylothermus subterraneus]